MVTETQKRIEAYRELLPGLREKVTAVAFLLALSVIMLTSASYAWLTISKAPEVTAVSTNIAANGSLEIALATGDGKNAPGDSKVGDSMAAEVAENVNPITRANVTWGNLINLNDASYGLDNLVLRPAQLNTAALLESPLYGSVFGGDGRVTQLSSNFGYAIWNLPEGDKPGYFGVSKDFGVRAISSTKIEAVGAAARYLRMVDDAKNKNLMAAGAYANLANNKDYMQSLATMMGKYMTARMNPDHATLSNPEIDVKDIQNLRDMYAAFLDCFDQEAEAMAEIANITLFLKHGTDENGNDNFTSYTKEKIYEATQDTLKADGITITGIEQFKKDRNTIAADLEKLKIIAESGGTLTWKDSGLNAIVNNLVDVGKCTIGADNTPINSIGASNAMGYLSGTQEARITNGILYRFEERTGGYIEVKNLGISATVNRMGMTIPATVKANIKTTAPRDYNLFGNDLKYAESLNDGNYKGGVAVAEDTYGLAVDLWVRTNSAGSYLTLEGNVLTESSEVQATGKDPNGKPVDLYTVKITETDEDGNSFSYSLDLYQVEGDNGEFTWYNIDNHAVITEDELRGNKPILKMETVVTVVGYEGDNRVWSDNQMISGDATTQGSGSCYVYYADTPEDQARSLKLLEAFKVAFVDGEGKLLASAIMDTEHFYAANGRVTVPLISDPSDSINLGEDYQGNISYAITALEQNVATRITAIVYLDGTKLTNSEVLSAADIHGQLNIQFGSSESLKPIGNEELEGKELKVSASVDKTSFDYDTATEPMTTNVTVNIVGDQPKTVTAFFMRAISATQGSREETMTFTKGDDNVWTSKYTFEAPGNYVLRSVQLDGVEHILENPQRVEVTGFKISSFRCEEAENNHVSIMTAENSKSVKLSMRFATDDESKLPKTVRATYLRDEDGSAVNAEFTSNSKGEWTATATFNSSGDYTLRYVVIDGEFTELDSAFWQTASVKLGMKVAVYTTSPHTFKYVPSEMEDNEKLLAMKVMILDNAGNELHGLSGVKLTYGMKGSGIKKMDTDLTWDGSYYVGELTTTTAGPGIWQFSNVTVGENTLTTATTSPTFTIQSPEPPVYYNHITIPDQYAPNNDATMNVQITNSAAASVQARIVNSDGKENWVTGEIKGEFTTTDGKTVNNWYFDVPKDANDYQDGHWTLTELRLWDVFAADGTAYTAEEPLIIDVSDTNNVSKVVSRVFITFKEDKSENFGKDANGNVTATFMTSHTISGLNVDIKDFENKPLNNISNVQLTFTYVNQSAQAKGGYTSTSLTNATEGATVKVDLDTNSGTNYAQSKDATILYAGEYATTFSFKVNGTPYSYAGETLPANTPVMTVWSKGPTVKISSVSTNVSTDRYYLSSTPSSLNVITGSYNRKIDDYNAVVYMYVSAQSGTLDQEQVTIKYPTVNLSLSGIPTTHSGVTMVFPSGNNTSSTFTFATGGTTAKATIGAGTNGAFNEGFLGIGSGVTTWPKFYPAGKQTVDEITVVYDGMTFTVDLSHGVTINNPLYPPYVDIVINDPTFNGTASYRIYSDNGETVKLPSINSWITNEIDVGSVSGEKVKSTSTERCCTGSRYNWTVYAVTTTVYEGTVTSTTWQNSHTITGWSDNTNRYDPGKEIAVNGSKTLTSVYSVVEVDGSRNNGTGTKVKTNVAVANEGRSYSRNAPYTQVSSAPTSYETNWVDP